MIYIIHVIGWIGTILMVTAYFLVSAGKVKSTYMSYQLMNLFGAVFLGINVFYQKAWPALAFEALWVLRYIFSYT